MDRSSRAVGSDGSGSISSGWRVILPEGERKASVRRSRAISARGDSVMERAAICENKMQQHNATIDIVVLSFILFRRVTEWKINKRRGSC